MCCAKANVIALGGSVRKAIIPAAGLGTRLGPITRAVPKEMFPLNQRAVIEYAVDEAIGAGIFTIGIIIRKGKEVIRDYLRDVFSERNMELVFIDQGKPGGLGDAILRCQEFVGHEPFVVTLPDLIFRPDDNPTRDLLDFFSRSGKTCFCLVERPKKSFHQYGSLRGVKVGENLYKISYISNDFNPEISFGDGGLRGCGRTIFTPLVFEFPRVERGGELSDGEVISWLIGVDEVWGFRVPYHPYDVGTYEGYVEAVEAFCQGVSEAKNKSEGL